MAVLLKAVVNCATGETTFVPLTPDEQTAYDAQQAAALITAVVDAQAATDRTTTRNAVLTAAGSAVGIGIGSLTAAQVRGLVACLLFKAGAIDKAGVVQPLNAWL